MRFLKRSPRLRPICWILALSASFLAGLAQAQVVPSAIGRNAFWVGGEYANLHASFPYQSNQRLWGIGGFADFRVTSHFGAEAEARFLRFKSFYGESEDNYLGGPRYLARNFGKLQPFAQGLFGLGKIQYPFQIGNGTYIAIAPGGGVSYRVAKRWSLRGEYEYQLWLKSPNIPNEPEHRLTPNGFHIGLSYKLLQ
jgi:hypothetical protein